MGQSAKISLRWCYGEYWPKLKSVNTISKYAVMNIFLHWQLGHDQHKCLLDGCCSLHIAYGIDIFINTVWTCLQSFHPRHFPNALDAAVFSAAAKIVAASQLISSFLRISFNNPIFWYMQILTPMSHPAWKNWPAWGGKRSGQQEVNMKFISIVKSFSFTIAKSFSFSIVKTTNSKINSTRAIGNIFSIIIILNDHDNHRDHDQGRMGCARCSCCESEYPRHLGSHDGCCPSSNHHHNCTITTSQSFLRIICTCDNHHFPQWSAPDAQRGGWKLDRGMDRCARRHCKLPLQLCRHHWSQVVLISV